MNIYHKIENVYKRNQEDKSKVEVGNWTKPEFEYLKDLVWQATEKVDGMNIRIIFDPLLPDEVRFAGKTDNAQFHPDLFKHLQDSFTTEKLEQVFRERSIIHTVCLYGEGYGAGIQKGGYYRPDKGFVLFDVKIGDSTWLPREQVEEIAKALNCPVVPILWETKLEEIIGRTSEGFVTALGRGFDLAEGVVCRPKVELKNGFGERVICKIKTKDFRNV